MASTPETSFSSNEGSCRRATKDRKAATAFELPSPQRSDSEIDCSHSTSERAAETHQAVEQAYCAIWNNFCGLPAPDSNPTFHLETQRSYEQLYEKLAEQKGLLGHFEDNIRRNWNAATGVLTLLLMPLTTLHELVKLSLESAIEKEVERIAREVPALRPFCEKLTRGGHADIQKKSGRSRVPTFDKSPDGQFKYKGARYPPLVFEVAYSQDDQSLTQTLTEFFEALPGRIATALGINIEYPRSRAEGRKRPGFRHSAKVSLWISESVGNSDILTVKRLINERVFRDGDGVAMPGEVVLEFKYLLPVEEHSNLPPDTGAQIRITFASLSHFIDLAEEQQRVEDQSPTPEATPRFKRIRFVGEDGEVAREGRLPRPKRQKARPDLQSSQHISVRTRSRTTSASGSRRSERLRSISRGRER